MGESEQMLTKFTLTRILTKITGNIMRQPPIKPGPGQESVWDYPRPPRLEPCEKHIVIVVSDLAIVDANHSFRVLETSHPPVYYFPRDSVRMDLVNRSSGGSFCEWKGQASYFDVQVGDRVIAAAAWCYAQPSKRFSSIAGFLAF